ncbi:D-2-hydroxyacid dehydrogenase [Marinomonas sp. THO17]|uniref:D-2-hydroxyacid dehydrogenase n=1 Tax=Marinomonas sp. THO17 TaxID=3149048 RepID=UPI00336C2289
MKAVFLDRGSFPQDIEIDLTGLVSEYVEFHNTSEDKVLQRIAEADIVLTNKVVLSAETVKQAHKLKLIQVMATGTNNVPMQTCQELGIKVQNVEGYSKISVPEHTFAMLLALRRNLLSYITDVKAGDWSQSEFFCMMDYPIRDLASSTMAIIGSGQLGQQVAILAKAFGMQVIFAERKQAKNIREGYMAFEEAIQQADIVSLHCPLTEETRNLVSTREFDLMPSHALLINMSRGGIVDESALVEAIQKNQIAGAAFDVSVVEPMPSSSPLNQLNQNPNFLLTPHIAWASEGAMRELVKLAIAHISHFVKHQ